MKVLRIILAIILGLVIGGLVNGLIIMKSSSIIPPPEGADFTTQEGLIKSMHLMQPKHFLMPFLAHALGTLIGALIAALIVKENKLRYALVIGFFFLIGGILNVMMLPSPLWFDAVDLLFAYIPFALIGWKLATIKKKTN